jgi:hypothetical protein
MLVRLLAKSCVQQRECFFTGVAFYGRHRRRLSSGCKNQVTPIKEGDPKAKGKAQAAAYCEHGGCFSLLTGKQN